MVTMEELVKELRRKIGVKPSVLLLLDTISGRIIEIIGSGGEAPMDRVVNIRDIQAFVESLHSNADEIGGAIAENQRQHPKAEHKYKKRAKK